MGLHLENEMAVVKTPTIISNNSVFDSELDEAQNVSGNWRMCVVCYQPADS